MEHKVRSLISSSAVFIGLLLPLRLPQFFWQIVIVASLAAALSVFWIFGEMPNFKRFKEDWFTILFILLFVLASSLFAYLVPNIVVQALILGATGIGLYFCYLVASRLKRNYVPSLVLRNIISLVAILGVFFAISDAMKWQLIYTDRLGQVLTILFSYVAVFVISEFLFEAQGIEKSVLYSLSLAFVVMQISWISSFWLISYPQSTRITNIGVPLPAILSSIYFYFFWGLAHHRLDNSLTKKIVWEYIVISVSFTAILLLTAQWMPR